MESPADPRDAWMRRAGPFFPLLVAAAGQTRLPVAPDLSPTDEDVARAEPWGPLVGGLLGLGLGFFAALMASLGLADVAVAALVASAWVVLGGAWAELGVARHLEKVFARSDSEGPGLAAALSLTLTLVVSLLLRVALLTSIDISAWTSALLVSAVVARFAPLVAHHGASLYAVLRKQAPAPSWPLLACAAAVIVGLPVAIGAAAVAAVITGIGLAVGAIITRLESPAAALVVAVELAVLVCFAASSTFPLFAA